VLVDFQNPSRLAFEAAKTPARRSELMTRGFDRLLKIKRDHESQLATTAGNRS
jgi:hypothetical protein